MAEAEHKGWMWVKCALALLVALLFVAVVFPDTGRIVIDKTTTPPTPHIVGRGRDSLIVMGMVTVPLMLIFIGTFRQSQLAIPGWILLAVLIVMLFLR